MAQLYLELKRDGYFWIHFLVNNQHKPPIMGTQGTAPVFCVIGNSAGRSVWEACAYLSAGWTPSERTGEAVDVLDEDHLIGFLRLLNSIVLFCPRP